MSDSLFRDKVNRINLVCMICCFIGNTFCSILLGVQMKYIRGKFYTNNLVGALSEIAAFTLSGILIKCCGIKPTLVVSYVIAFSGMLALLLTTTMNQLYLSFFILGCKFGISCAKSTAYLANFWIFPQNIVATAFGICNIVGKLFTIFAPYVAELKPESISQTIFVIIMSVTLLTSLAIIEPKEEEDILPTKMSDEKLEKE